MENTAVVDLETTGLDTETVDTHCMVIQYDGMTYTYGDQNVATCDADLDTGYEYLANLIDDGVVIAGHNIIEYDLPILMREDIHVPDHQVYDSLVVSRAIYPGTTLVTRDIKFLKGRKDLEGELMRGAHSLKSWGLRIGNLKGDYDGGWEKFSQAMLDYCVQDVLLNEDLLSHQVARMPLEAARLECQVSLILRRMRLHGVAFDVEAAQAMACRLADQRGVIADSVRDVFPDWIEAAGVSVPKRSQNRKHKELIDGKIVEVARMEKGVSYVRPKTVQFNPASGAHIARCFQHHYDWKPQEYTEGGKPSVTSEILRDLRFPEAAPLAEYQEIKKTIGYLAEGQNAWLKLEKNGRLHGKVNSVGTVTGRAAHSKPNLGNVPVRTKLGRECRSLFVAGEDNVIVGADASGLQLRILAHYLARWDGGVFARQCEDGDVHEFMRKGTGLFYRDTQKTWTYAMLFGAGDALLGMTVLDDWHKAWDEGLTTKRPPHASEAADLGATSLRNLGNAIPAFPKLVKALKKAAKIGHLTGLDGRRIPVLSQHTALSSLLQGGEAVVMKKAMVWADAGIREWGGAYVLWVHDEFQVEVMESSASDVGAHLVNSIRWAGEEFKLRVALDGEYKTGASWEETH